MVDDWPIVTVESIAQKTASGPFGSNLRGSEYVAVGVPVIRGNNLSGPRFHDGDYVYVADTKADELHSSLAYPLDIVFAARGTIGAVGIVPQGHYPRLLLSSNLVKVSVDPKKADPHFVFYYFRSQRGQNEILAHVNTTGVPKIERALESLRHFHLPKPPLRLQQAIACILGTLDDKIELNRRMNETLEAMAQAIFKSWFVDFDPVRAKAIGQQPSGLAPYIADLFPECLVDSELGEIPAGWKVATLGDACQVIDCLHSKKPERRDAGLPLLQLSNIRDDGLIDMADTYFINDADYAQWISRMEASAGDCVITNVGRVGAVAQMPRGLKAALGRNMTGVRCKPDFPFPTFVIGCLLSDVMKAEISRHVDTGTILDALNVRSIPKLRFVRASYEVLVHFEQACRPLRARMEDALAGSRTLAALRDTLLPKLISGELRVPDAERIVGRCL